MSEASNTSVNRTNVYDAKDRRDAAVGLALEIIKAKCLGGDAGNLSNYMDNLSVYADRIQEALNKDAE
ncbi:hypothetical protein [Spongiibacter marinus]|uniref:hypothetical protein n=1 Tax=Spongiibacter marinus TaxID=354246 RepID=UPI0035644D5B